MLGSSEQTTNYTGTWKSVHMWNQGKNCMGRRAFRKSNKSMQPGLKLHGTHYVEVLLLDPWQCTFLLPNFPNPHQDACAQLCPIILKIYAKFSKSPSGRVSTHESQICLNNNLKECFWWLSWRNLIRSGRLRDSNVAKWMYSWYGHMLGDSERGPDEVQTRSKRGPKCLKQQPLFKSPILKIFSNPPACRRVWLEGVVLVSVLGLYLFLYSSTSVLLYSSTPLLLPPFFSKYYHCLQHYRRLQVLVTGRTRHWSTSTHWVCVPLVVWAASVLWLCLRLPFFFFSFFSLLRSCGLPPRMHIKLPWGHLSMAGGLAGGNEIKHVSLPNKHWEQTPLHHPSDPFASLQSFAIDIQQWPHLTSCASAILSHFLNSLFPKHPKLPSNSGKKV